ncbi:hypothetical protein DL766_002252 [Monosporascus sp. MC13-8B]|uniref:Uncharacterized protein n=1 Tax=Monosporascus cannonballus TaxID=155416 RepID=A0ABY0HLA7_9PEZI|nr:hypothetical protein DL763_004124 [Monosporascus cannonballus]RYO94593.1 hypothetical protein DL762_000485 [Monosporascus cannonballus]RYP35982.1 hypothetical protein DL766_002252 [Monosporascus sp. MC13-8B]
MQIPSVLRSHSVDHRVLIQASKGNSMGRRLETPDKLRLSNVQKGTPVRLSELAVPQAPVVPGSPGGSRILGGVARAPVGRRTGIPRHAGCFRNFEYRSNTPTFVIFQPRKICLSDIVQGRDDWKICFQRSLILTQSDSNETNFDHQRLRIRRIGPIHGQKPSSTLTTDPCALKNAIPVSCTAPITQEVRSLMTPFAFLETSLLVLIRDRSINQLLNDCQGKCLNVPEFQGYDNHGVAIDRLDVSGITRVTKPPVEQAAPEAFLGWNVEDVIEFAKEHIDRWAEQHRAGSSRYP